MAARDNLRATVLFTLLLITEGMNPRAMIAAKHELKTMAHKVLRKLQNESICIREEPRSVHTLGCLTELKNKISACERVSILGTYFSEAADLDIQTLMTEELQAISQHLQSFQKHLCKSEPEVKKCDVYFKESDGDYEKFCRVMSLLELLIEWLSR